jgi:hypothetical protein
MTLGQQQRLFGKLFGQLLVYIYSQGYEVSLDWGYRPPAVAAYYASIGVGIRSSLHSIHLAEDLNLFKNGVYLRDTHSWLSIGDWWEKQHPLCRWGGRFGDGNHFSMEWNGVK